MVKCPNCNEKTITNLQKINLSPLSEIDCPNCQASISMPWTAMVFKLTYLAVMIMVIFRFDLELFEFTALLVSVLCLDGYTRFRFVPLIVKKKSNL